MNKKTYTNIGELELIFRDYMVPYETFKLHKTETGVSVMGMIDEKSKVIYLERYNPIVESKEVYSVDSVELPLTWRVDTISEASVEISFTKGKVVVV